MEGDSSFELNQPQATFYLPDGALQTKKGDSYSVSMEDFEEKRTVFRNIFAQLENELLSCQKQVITERTNNGRLFNDQVTLESRIDKLEDEKRQLYSRISRLEGELQSANVEP